jgi:hypothetical protein
MIFPSKMTEEQEEAHRKRMLAHLQKLRKQIGILTPIELANAISEVKKKYPKDFPK